MANKTAIDITPSPRILRMLGEIDFKAWQCVCEIVDNSIDAFLALDDETSTEAPKIKIKLPSGSKNDLLATDELIIEDNAEGMTFEKLSKSIKAGFSSNNPVDKMGLFGMGFNISTARLGYKTEVITSTIDSDDFLKVTIDFYELEKGGTFAAPVERIPKKADEKTKHGTTVKITNLRIDHVKPLFQKSHISKKLGKIYGRIIREKNIKILYNGSPCKAFEHCVWSPLRMGHHKSGAVPAKIEINTLIDTKNFCATCWTWLSNKDSECPACGEIDDLLKRERRVKGWVGIQRYFDSDHYGVDLIRNGRVITELDKSFFYMLNLNEELELEYPRDGFQAIGRIVGELEVDFIKVTFQKDAFDTNSIDWRDLRRVVRGDGPMQPLIAKSLGFAENDTPISRLFNTFRTAKADKIANLIPKKSTGEAMLKSELLSDMTRRFHDGEKDYQSDEKWWDLLTETHKPGSRAGSPNPADPTGGSPFTPAGNAGDRNNGNTENMPTTRVGIENVGPIGEPDDQPDTEPDKILSDSYSLDLFKNIAIRVIAERSKTPMGGNGFHVKVKGPDLFFTYWPKAPIFDNSLLMPADFLVNELAFQLHKIAENEVSRVPITQVELALREKYFPELHPTVDELVRSIKILSEELKEHLNSKGEGDIDVSAIDHEEIKSLKKRMAKNEFLNKEEVDSAVIKGQFLSYASLTAIKSIVCSTPSLVFDGVFFKQKWTKTQSTDENFVAIWDELNALMSDVEWFDQNHTYPSGDLWRARTKRLIGSLEIIANWRA